MSTSNLPTPRRALAIAAHPDDVEFGCGATLAKWTAGGCQITHVICTDGSKGTWDANADLDALRSRRQREQRAASIALGGAGEVEFLDRVDGELDSDLATRALVCAAIRRHRPDIVLGHDPWKRYRLHPDHRHAGLLAIEGVVAARDPHFFPEQLTDGVQPHRPDAIMLFEAEEPNHLEHAEESAFEARVAALLAHESQHETTHFKHAADAADPAAEFTRSERTKLENAAAEVSSAESPGSGLAESFRLLTDL